ncbi:MAG: nucleotidyltransferase family protein [Polyangiaceae bacterium]
MSRLGSQRFSAVLLAAGLSRRMGGPNKLLLPVAGQPLVARSLDTLLASGVAEAVVVLGHEAERVRTVLAPLAASGVARFVTNPEYETGQVSSVRAGLSALSEAVDGVMICLADQPALTASDLIEVQRAFAERPRGDFLVPIHDGQRGNPVVLAWPAVREVLEQGTNLGCRHFMDRHDERVYRWQAPNDHVLKDLDQPADYAALSKGGGDT